MQSDREDAVEENFSQIRRYTDEEVTEEHTKSFTYSLFYIFFDQYTYIRGVLAQNALLGLAAVILAIQV